MAMMVGVIGGCSTIELTPGVNLFSTEMRIERKADNASAVYRADLTNVEPTFILTSEAFIIVEVSPKNDDGGDSLGINFAFQAPTRFRLQQTDGTLEPRVEGKASYLAAFLRFKYSDPVAPWLLDRYDIGLGIGRITLNGQADFNPGDLLTTPIDAKDNRADIYFVAFGTNTFLGFDNLVFRAALASYFFEDNQFRFSVSGLVLTIGYAFGAGLFENMEEKEIRPEAASEHSSGFPRRPLSPLANPISQFH